MEVNEHSVEQEEVMAYLDGELPSDREAFVAAHMEECGECRRLAVELRSVSRQLMMWRVEMPQARIPRKPKRTAIWVGVGGLVAACLLIAVLVPPMRMQYPDRARLDLARRGLSAELVSPARRLIARTSQLVLVTKDFDKARGALEDILKRHHGYVGQMDVTAPGGAPRALEATLRVPADQLDPTVAEIKNLGLVESESQRGEDVTQQYVDLDARLANGRHTEQRLTALLHDRTGKIAEVLVVETEIDRVRGEIERMEAEKKALANSVDFATLSVRLREAARAQLSPPSTWDRFGNAVADGWSSLRDDVVLVTTLLLSYGPSLLLWGGLLFVSIRFIVKRARKANALLKFGGQRAE
jgi:hypothetical protein